MTPYMRLLVSGLLTLSAISGCATPSPSSFSPRGKNIDVSGCPPFVGPHIPDRIGQIGSVRVKLTVNADGSIQDPQVTSEWPAGLGLGQIALDGLDRCHFRPKIENGAPVTATKYLQLNFGFE